MSDKANWRERCHCSHDRATHHEGRHNCLGLYCDCRTYRNEWGPVKPKEDSVIPPPPETDPDFDDEDDDDDVTVKMPWGYP